MLKSYFIWSEVIVREKDLCSTKQTRVVGTNFSNAAFLAAKILCLLGAASFVRFAPMIFEFGEELSFLGRFSIGR